MTKPHFSSLKLDCKTPKAAGKLSDRWERIKEPEYLGEECEHCDGFGYEQVQGCDYPDCCYTNGRMCKHCKGDGYIKDDTEVTNGKL